MVTNFKKSFLLLITAIFFTQSLILGCSTEVDSEIQKMEEDKETSKTPVFVGTWDSFDETITIDDKFTFSLETKKESGTVQDVNNGFKCVSTTKDDKGNNKTYNFTKVEADVISSSDVVTGKTVYFVKHSDSQKDAELNGIWECDNGTEIIINAETKKICVTTENGQIWGTYTQNGNTFVIADENGNILGSGFVSASGKAYFYNEATDSFEIYTKDAEAGAPVIPLKKFTVTYKSEFADDVVKPCAENVEITLEDASYEGYRFDGWYTNAEKTAKAEATYTIAENLTFYAKWVQQGTVKFISAQSEHADVTVDLGTEIIIEDPTKEKFAFDGWFIGETKVSGKYTVTKDVELVAKWTALYNVTFETAGGSPVDSLENVRAGTKITLDETKWDGYEFEWWAAEGKTYAIGVEYEVNSDVIFVAKWAGLCKVVYNTDGGTPVESETVHDMETIDMPAAPTKDGYRFLGWYTTDENNLMQPGDVFNVTDSVTINAKWVAVYTYEYNDGIPADEDPNYQAPTVDDGYILTLKAAPVRDGYVFKGWSDGETTYAVGDKYTITKDTVFTAEWKQLFTYEYNDGIPADEDPNYQAPTEEDGEVLTLKSAPVREGYVFKGWKVGEQLYDAGATYTITADVVFVAVWNPIYSYEYVGGYGSGELEKDKTLKIADAPKAEGCSFGGWSDGVTVWQPGDVYTITADVEFTPIWNVTVTYVSKYSQPKADVIKKGESLVLPPLTHDGYTFGGWDNGSETISGGASFVVDADITFTAVWTKDPVAYSISGVPTNETWTSGTVVAWVWNDDVESGFYVVPNFDKGTADYTFETAEDISYCTIFVVDSMPSEPVKKDALTEKSTAKSADMYFSSGKAVFEAVYTIINVSDWYDNASAEIYISYEKDGETQWINVTDNVEDAENGTLTIEFQSSDVITECTLSRFDPDVVDGLSDLSSADPWNSVDLIFGDSCFTEFHDKFAIDSSKVYFKNAASFGIGIYVYFYNEGDSLPSTSNLSALTQMTAEPNGDGWYGAPADFTKEKVAFYGKDGNQNNSGWTIDCDLIEGKIFFKAAGEKNTSGSNSGKYNMESFSSIKDALSKEVSKSTN
ncbi:MAG: InlB B-repeat-containing protein [Treponema sp.]|nr:InlB B-repeat-containing protein [Treponema sp.]